tara:strand:- start:198 stop:503 length:306 start_codon:yes stop_codon:yes gene_type:complete
VVRQAGVDNGRGDGSSFVRAWVVLTPEGKDMGVKVVAKKLDDWVKSRLSKHKWLTGGVEAVDSVCVLMAQVTCAILIFRRFQELHQARCCGERCGTSFMRG